MKLAEALIERAELQKENAKLLERIKNNSMVQEGDTPAEKPEELIAQYEHNMERFLVLVRKINETNSKTDIGDGMSIADAIAIRDCLGAKHRAYQNMYAATTISVSRYSQNEIKFVRCIDPKGLQKQIDKLAKEYRELDTKLQGFNWTVDLV
jgi:hypothetical protein